MPKRARESVRAAEVAWSRFALCCICLEFCQRLISVPARGPAGRGAPAVHCEDREKQTQFFRSAQQ